MLHDDSSLRPHPKLETRDRDLRELYNTFHYAPGASPSKATIRREEHWKKDKCLGSGAFASVWLENLVTDSSEGEYRATKQINKLTQQSGAIDPNRELETITMFSRQEYESPESVFIAMEYFPLGDLSRHLSQPLLEKDTQRITYQVLEGLSFMHGKGFAHRDLKPANILVQSKGPDWWVKIGDFGISKRAEDGVTAFRTYGGTPGFMAPEIVAHHGFAPRKEYTVAVDIWSLGVVAFYALTGNLPFSTESLEEYVRGASRFPVKMLSTHKISEEGRNFLYKLMAPIPEDRLTARGAISHIWI
ncbi:MAG: hypothetical protein M1840_008736 [Geoglossum simile]|nr:MAG: hypothetical protein M1840_008736 [Geoglossum simile]